MAHEAEEYPAMSESTTDIRIVPLPKGQDGPDRGPVRSNLVVAATF
jgi:hypothetical protein